MAWLNSYIGVIFARGYAYCKGTIDITEIGESKCKQYGISPKMSKSHVKETQNKYRLRCPLGIEIWNRNIITLLYSTYISPALFRVRGWQAESLRGGRF